MPRRISALFACSFAVAAAATTLACVEVPDSMRAEFAGPGPNDRTNYKPGTHGAAPANDTHFKIPGSYDAGADAATPDQPSTVEAPDAAAAPLATDGGNS